MSRPFNLHARSNIGTWKDEDRNDALVTAVRGKQIVCVESLEFGAVCIQPDTCQLRFFPASAEIAPTFEAYTIRRWIPCAFTLTARQVIHASAVCHVASGRVVAFVGATHAGKSTLGYALGRRRGWQQIADDGMAFRRAGAGMTLQPMPATISLRPPSAAHFQQTPYTYARLDWPSVPIRLHAVYVLQREDTAEGTTQISVMLAAEGYPALLGEAYIVNPDDRLHRLQVAEDYLELVKAIPVYCLRYVHNFAQLDATLNQIEQHTFSR